MPEYGLTNPLAREDGLLELATATGPAIADADPRPETVANYVEINAARLLKIRELERQLTGEEALTVEGAFSAAVTPAPSSVDDDNRPDEVPEVALARKAAALLADGEWTATA